MKQAEPGAAPEGATQQMSAPYILLVDDNSIQAQARKAILARVGVEVIIAADAAQAVAGLQAELLEAESPRLNVGIMVTDHLMPGMNGPELVAAVRALLPTLPILVLSGLPDAEAEYEPGTVLFRAKPFPPPELIRLVRHMLGESVLRSA